MELQNNGFEFAMFMLLVLGYLMLFLYTLIMLFVCLYYVRRGQRRVQRRDASTRILNTISRVKFSEDLFGARNDENACIICMETYKEDDTITRLRCHNNHFFHTNCIESWIRRGGNACPVCKVPIL